MDGLKAGRKEGTNEFIRVCMHVCMRARTTSRAFQGPFNRALMVLNSRCFGIWGILGCVSGYSLTTLQNNPFVNEAVFPPTVLQPNGLQAPATWAELSITCCKQITN